MFGTVVTWRSRARGNLGKRFLGVESLEDRRMLSLTFTVTTIFDDGGSGGITNELMTLRRAIELVNQDLTDTPADPDQILFNINPDFQRDGLWTIVPKSALPALVRPAIIDGSSQPGYATTPVIRITGVGLTGPGDGLTLSAGSDSSAIRAMLISDFAQGNAISISGSSGNQIIANVLQNTANGSGVDVGGSGGNTLQGNQFQGNATGINIAGSGGNSILANQIQGSGTDGINISDNGGDTIQGNQIQGNGTTGINIAGSGGNSILANQIQGSGTDGISISDNGGDTIQGNQIQGNGTTGIDIASAGGNVVRENQIQGNGTAGINIAGSGGNVIQGNQINGNGYGLTVQGAGNTGNTIGGTTDTTRNFITGSVFDGILINQAVGNLVEGNRIGFGAAGTFSPNGRDGISLTSGANSNTIGGTSPGARNLISGSTTGIQLSGSNQNSVLGNFIGTTLDGEAAVGNETGIFVGGSGNTIGRNLISGNSTIQVHLSGGSASSNTLSDNLIGTDASGQRTIAVSGNTVGILIENSPRNTVGPNNVIAGFTAGINLAGGDASGNRIVDNYIGTNSAPSGTPGLGNTVGVYINGAPGNIIGGLDTSGNIISGNTQAGVYIYGAPSSGNQVMGNMIGLAPDRVTAFQSATGGSFVQSVGIAIVDASRNLIGGASRSEGNVLTGNSTAGVYILGHSGSSVGNVVENNRIGLSADGSQGAGNGLYGVLLYNAPNNRIVQTGRNANQFGGNAAANVRDFNGPDGAASALLSHRTRSRVIRHHSRHGKLSAARPKR